MRDLKQKEWNESYARGENAIFYPHEEVVRFINRFIRKRVSEHTFSDVIYRGDFYHSGVGIIKGNEIIESVKANPQALDSQGEVSCDDSDIETPIESKHSKISKETAQGLFCDDKSGLSSEQARSKAQCLESKDSQAAGFSDDFRGFQAKGEGSYLKGNDRALSVESAKSAEKPTRLHGGGGGTPTPHRSRLRLRHRTPKRAA